MAGVILEQVRKTYDNGFVAVHGLDLVVDDGEFVVLVGPSGCGKSTTLRMVAGLETPSAGLLTIGGRVVNDVPPNERDIAMVFQSYALYPHMSVYENMAFALRLRKLSAREIDRRVRRAAEVLGITTSLSHKPRQLSGGQRQRVAIGRAIVREPSVFLFDEPLSNLDAKLRVQMRREIARLHRELGVTVLYVTHDQVEAMTLGDRIVVMNTGRLEQTGAPLEVYDRPASLFVAGFIGSPPMNLVPGTIEDTSDGAGPRYVASGGSLVFRLTDEQRRRLAPYAGKAIVAGVRPEDVRLLRGHGSGSNVGTFPVTVDAAEPLGNEVLIYAHAGDWDLTARSAPRGIPAAGATATLAVESCRVHYFDAESTRVIVSAEAGPSVL